MDDFNVKIDGDFDGLGIKNLSGSVFTFKSRTFFDERGYFSEIWKDGCFPLPFNNSYWIRQCNVSKSGKYVFRGMHMQTGDSSQGKFIRCLNGSIIDVIVDMRLYSNSFRTLKTYALSCDNSIGLWIPPGFLHGFLSMSDDTVFQYMCNSVYDRESERGVNIMSIIEDGTIKNPNDEMHRRVLELMSERMILSEKDKRLPDVGNVLEYSKPEAEAEQEV